MALIRPISISAKQYTQITEVGTTVHGISDAIVGDLYLVYTSGTHSYTGATLIGTYHGVNVIQATSTEISFGAGNFGNIAHLDYT